MLRPGIFLQDRYEIIEKIGSGGMSDVYKAKCHKLNRLVAIKVLKEEFSEDDGFVSKFKLEAQSAARLSHPNIVNVYDVVDEGDLHYIVMELIEGITLKNYIAKKGRLEVKETIGIAIQVASGIEAAHEEHIIHRDIKPQNMIISRDGKVKVTDFGIARAASSQTMSSTAMGSVHYFSPEQARGGYSDERSDIYSLGITMYEMVTGHVPFGGDNTVSIALAHLEQPIKPPSAYVPSVPVSLEQIILKCTEKKPERRYGSAQEVIEDLRRALVRPDEDFVVKTAPPDSSAHTVTISAEELARIKEGKRKAGSGAPARNRQEPARKTGSGPSGRKRPPADDDDVNPQMEKLLTAAGVIIAVIIVAVVVVVFLKVGGLFHMGGTGKDNGASVESAGPSLSDKEVLMPDVLGLSMDEAGKKLEEQTLTMQVSGYEFSDQYEKGEVMEQEVAKDTVVEKHSKVKVTISNGSDKIDLASLSLKGMDGQKAKLLLEQKGLVVSSREEVNETVEKGQVAGFTPQKAAEGETVTLMISSGPPVTMSEVPSLLGHTSEEAAALLADAGLVAGEVKSESDDTVEEGKIISQAVASGIKIEKGSAISYVVSSGKEPETKPSPGFTGGYVGSISKEFNLRDVFGPGAESFTVTIKVTMTQNVNGQDMTTVLMEPRTLTGDKIVQIHYSSIQGAAGVDSGRVDVVDISDGRVLKSYPISFIPQ